MTFEARYEGYKALAEERLAGFFPGGGLYEVMRYSLLAGGKRIRPVLALAFCEAAGAPAERALDFACAVEMLHTYSLIHDDLPCMDDDDLRRGKPTCHKVYGETAAVLAGDALQAAAFTTILRSGGFPDGEAPRQAALALAEAAGERGMCLGQYWDTLGTDAPDSLEALDRVHDRKTGDLLRAACAMGVIAATGGGADADPACLAAARDYAGHLGLAFQIRDDVLDVTSTPETLGKPIGSDAQQGKVTYVTLAGVEESERAVARHTRLAQEALDRAAWRGDPAFLCWLADRLARRSY